MARRGERGIRNIRVNGRRVWQARVAWQGQRRSRLCESYDAARQARVEAARPDFRFPGGPFFPEDETRVRWLRPEEELLVLEPMLEPFRSMAKLAALTLVRQGELRLLRREQVHLDQGVVLLPRAKGGARPVILSQGGRQEAATSSPRVSCAPPRSAGPSWWTARTVVSRSARRSGGLRGPLACAISIFMTCGTTAPLWPLTAASRPPS
jgi:integrase